MQDAVHEEQRDLVVVGAGVFGRVARRDRGTDHDVAEQRRQVVGFQRLAPGRGSTGVGPAAGLLGVVIEWKRQYVGGAGLAEEPLVEPRDRRLVDEEHGQLRISFDLLGPQHVARQRVPARRVDRVLRLLIGDEDFDTHGYLCRREVFCVGGVVALVGRHDVRHDLVANDVAFVEPDELDVRRRRRGLTRR